MRKKGPDVVMPITRNAVVQSWIEETCVSPNKGEVTRKKLGPCIYDEKVI